MKKMVYAAAVLLMAIVGVGCGKKDGGGDNNAYNRYGYGGYNQYGQYNSGSGICIDTRYGGQQTNPVNCQNGLPGFQWQAGGFHNGGFGPGYNNQPFGIQGNSFCGGGQYGTALYPIVYGATGNVLCVEYFVYQQMMINPSIYPGYSAYIGYGIR